MKVYFGFNDIRQDGMGSAAMTLLHALNRSGLKVQAVHPWKQVQVPEYFQLKPIFLSESSEEPPLSESIRDMIEVINSDPESSVFSHFGSPNWGAIIPYLRSDIRVVVSVHSVTPSALKIALANSQRTNKFVAVSWEVEKLLRRKLPPRDHWKIALVTNAIDVDRFVPKKEFGKPGDRVKIVFFGRIEDYTKGADKISKIAQKLKQAGLDFEWHLYGYFHWGYENRFFEQVKKLQVEDVISYKDCLTPSQIPAMLTQYDIMVMPSNHEGFGLSLIESMAAGLVCIASKLSGVTERIIDNGNDGILVGRNDIKGFVEAILMASTDLKLREKLGNAAREKVVTQFSIEQHGLRYRKVFEEAMEDQSTLSVPMMAMPSKESFSMPESLKPHILARILPNWLKRELKKII